MKYGGKEALLRELHALTEARTATTLPPIQVAIRRGDPWVLAQQVVHVDRVMRGRSDIIATALSQAQQEAGRFRVFWGRMAGIVPD